MCESITTTTTIFPSEIRGWAEMERQGKGHNRYSTVYSVEASDKHYTKTMPDMPTVPVYLQHIAICDRPPNRKSPHYFAFYFPEVLGLICRCYCCCCCCCCPFTLQRGGLSLQPQRLQPSNPLAFDIQNTSY